MGENAAGVILAAENVVDLQYALMDAAKRLTLAGEAHAATDDLLASAAALDYALLLASSAADEEIDPNSAVGSHLRDTMTRAATAALDALDRMLRSRDRANDDFIERNLRPGGLFDVVRDLNVRGVCAGPDLAFRALTLASDASERPRR